NNEIVGPYGPGTVFTPISSSLAAIRTGMAYKATKIGQLLSNIISGFGKKKETGGWKGLEMFLGNQVAPDDPRLETVYSHYRRNLEELRQIALDAGSNIIFCTVANNLKDSPPFASMHSSTLKPVDKLNWEGIYQKGVEIEGMGSVGYNAEALKHYRSALQIDGTYAGLHFRMARCYWNLGDYENAKESYIQARETDSLRFRADLRINSIIRETAAARNGSSSRVSLVDVVEEFRQESLHGIPGEELFYEHVHMNFHGNYLLARALFKQIEAIVPQSVKTLRAGTASLPGEEECARHLAYTSWDQYSTLETVLNDYIKNPPYSNQLYHQPRVQRLEQRIQALVSRLTPEVLQEDASLYRQAIEKIPSDGWLRKKYANFLYKVFRDYPEAEKQYREVVRCLPHTYEGYSGLGFVLNKLQRNEEAIAQNLKAIARHPYKPHVYNNNALALYQNNQIPEA
ncbi:MAG: tetratricopeptide repeat protein, partial [bacterium]|nr:tetratricopeptide repeat protein [bacterium]